MIDKKSELVEIITKAGDIVPFLKNLKKEEKKSLLPVLAELNQKYNQRLKDYNDKSGFGPLNNYVYPMIHQEIIKLAGVVIVQNVTQYRQNISGGAENDLLSESVIDKILPWYLPKWFQTTINRPRMVWFLNYEKLLHLKNMGYLKPSDELITLVFERSACRLTRGKGREAKNVYSHDLLIQNKEAMSEHFWLLFEYESAINNHYLKDQFSWYNIIPELLDKNLINKERLIRSCLLVCTKGFNRTQTAWYYKLLKKLNPSISEHLECQNELMTCLNSGQSSAINYTLPIIKKLISEESFSTMDFIYASQTLINLPIKSIVRAVLVILEKLMKQTSEFKEEIIECFINVLSHDDNDIQTKSAKFIKKHLEPSEANKQKISIYQDELMIDAKEILHAFIINEVNPSLELSEPDIAGSIPHALSDDNKIPPCQSFDDMVFFLTQFNEKEEYWHTEQILSILPKINKLINEDNVEKLNQFFCNGLSQVSSFSWDASKISVIYSHLINDFAEQIEQRFPNVLVGRKKYIKRLIAIHVSYGPPFQKLTELKDEIHPILRLISKKVKYAQELLHKNLDLELLSIPTHIGGWIDPEIHIFRINKFEEHNLPINLIDWQMSVMRLYRDVEITPEFKKKLNSVKNSTLVEVLQYLYGIGDLDDLSESTLDYFMPAILNKGNQQDIKKASEAKSEEWARRIYDFKWGHHDIEFLTWKYDRNTNQSYRAIDTKCVLHIDGQKYKRHQQSTPSNSLISKVKNIFLGNSKRPDEVADIQNPPRIKRIDALDYYDFMSDRKILNKNYQNYIFLQSRDTKKYLSLTPNNKQMYLNLIIHYQMETSTPVGEDGKRLIVNALEYLVENWYLNKEHEITYVFLAASILNQNKIARQLVSELSCFVTIKLHNS